MHCVVYHHEKKPFHWLEDKQFDFLLEAETDYHWSQEKKWIYILGTNRLGPLQNNDSSR